MFFPHLGIACLIAGGVENGGNLHTYGGALNTGVSQNGGPLETPRSIWGIYYMISQKPRESPSEVYPYKVHRWGVLRNFILSVNFAARCLCPKINFQFSRPCFMFHTYRLFGMGNIFLLKPPDATLPFGGEHMRSSLNS